MELYKERLSQHSAEVSRLRVIFNRLAFGRLLFICGALVSGYFLINKPASVQTILFVLCLFSFLLFMRWHLAIKKRILLHKALQQINQEELDYVTDAKLSFEDGKAFINEQHSYTYDLDVFGPHSLFQHLNRTKTVPGKKTLVESLLIRLDNKRIKERQEAIAELVPLVDWRQLFTAKALLANDSEKVIASLNKWNANPQEFSWWIQILLYVLPLSGAILTILGIFQGFSPMLLNALGLVFTVNLVILTIHLKRMNAEIGFAEKINQTLLHYSELLEQFEQQSWNASLLRELQQQVAKNQPASRSIHQLSRIFGSLESLQNGFGAILFNGTLLFHLHTYRKLIAWKKAYVEELPEWINLIGEIEMLLTFANLATNNPDFCFPQISDSPTLRFSELGHPMIPIQRRVTNTIDFSQHPFIILTGSNMSGKSTFLRTLGINLILSNAGSVICAKKATVFPMDVLVSMRLSDSLTDNQSYFFAEVKRLGEIMQTAENKRCFVLLDELLRGTNSDDKRSGTIAVVRRLAKGNAIGVIATHDLEVCQTTEEFPEKLVNKCFEVTITANELQFDYLLRDGICQNKSATYLMKSMGII